MCKHCDIWNNPYKKELSINKIKEIINSKIIQDSYNYYSNSFDIAISWWEPLLITNLHEIITIIDNSLPWSIHSISTNWVLTNKLIELLIYWKKKWKTFKKINISIDWNKEIHDYQRGIDWSFNKSIVSIKKIKKIFPDQIIEIKLTITKNNYKNIIFISKLADKLWIFFSFKPVENMENFTNQKNKHIIDFKKDEIEKIKKQIINNKYIIKQNKYINKSFFLKIPKYISNWLWYEKKDCTIANESITIMPDWKVYSCILMNKIWDLNINNIDNIWYSNNLKEQRQKIKDWKCPECMLMCGSFKSKKIYEK